MELPYASRFDFYQGTWSTSEKASLVTLGLTVAINWNIFMNFSAGSIPA
jgi:hypothetical protein